MENNKKEFLIEEYKKCWEYIEFHYSQRDRSQRFYFTFVLGSAGLIAALLKVRPDLPSNPNFYLSLNMIIIPLFLFGIFCVGQIISLRKTTTRFHKAIVTIRAQFLTKNETKLWVSDSSPKFLNNGFNFYTAVIVMIVNGFIIACCPMTISLYLGGIKILYVLIAIFVWSFATFVQLNRYKSILKNEDDSYVSLFNTDIIEKGETEHSV